MAAGSKKLPLLYSLICSGRTLNCARANAICFGIAPSGTVSVSVFFHKSHIRQRQGHSLLVSRIVPELTTRPDRARSCSRKKECGWRGSRAAARRGRCAVIHAESPSVKGEVTVVAAQL